MGFGNSFNGGVGNSQPYTQSASISLSGASYDFTDIPAWATKISLKIAGLSISGTSDPIIQLGDSGGIETTGYDGLVTALYPPSTIESITLTQGLGLANGVYALMLISGVVDIELVSGSTNSWLLKYQAFQNEEGSRFPAIATCVKSLSAQLDRIRFTTVGGVDSFTSGVVSISWQ